MNDIARQAYYPGSRHRIEVPEEETEKTVEWDANPKRYTINGVEHEFFTVGALAKALGRSPVTIRQWEREGVIPSPTFRRRGSDPRGNRRLYSRQQILGLVEIAKQEGILSINQKPIKSTHFASRALDLFKALA